MNPGENPLEISNDDIEVDILTLDDDLQQSIAQEQSPMQLGGAQDNSDAQPPASMAVKSENKIRKQRATKGWTRDEIDLLKQLWELASQEPWDVFCELLQSQGVTKSKNQIFLQAEQLKLIPELIAPTQVDASEVMPQLPSQNSKAAALLQPAVEQEIIKQEGVKHEHVAGTPTRRRQSIGGHRWTEEEDRVLVEVLEATWKPGQRLPGTRMAREIIDRGVERNASAIVQRLQRFAGQRSPGEQPQRKRSKPAVDLTTSTAASSQPEPISFTSLTLPLKLQAEQQRPEEQQVEEQQQKVPEEEPVQMADEQVPQTEMFVMDPPGVADGLQSDSEEDAVPTYHKAPIKQEITLVNEKAVPDAKPVPATTSDGRARRLDAIQQFLQLLLAATTTSADLAIQAAGRNCGWLFVPVEESTSLPVDDESVHHLWLLSCINPNANTAKHARKGYDFFEDHAALAKHLQQQYSV